MATFNKYYLDNSGLQALIEKIKANDNKLAELIGLPTGWATDNLPADYVANLDTTDAAVAATILGQLIDAIDGASTDVQGEIEDILGYDDLDWPTETDPDTGEEVKLTVNERLNNLMSLAVDAQAAADKGFKSFRVDQNNSLQTITIYANTVETNDLSHEGWKPVGTIDTTDFIVHGMLSDVRQVTLDDNNINLDNGPRYDNGTASDNTDDLLLAENVLMEIFQKTENIVGADISAAKAAGRLPQSYLLMTFGVHPDADGQSIHDDDAEKRLWVNVSSMVKQYEFHGDDLIEVTTADNGGTVTVNIKASDDLKAAGQLAEEFAPYVNEQGVLELDFPTIAMGDETVEHVWTDPTWDPADENVEPEPEPEP